MSNQRIKSLNDATVGDEVVIVHPSHGMRKASIEMVMPDDGQLIIAGMFFTVYGAAVNHGHLIEAAYIKRYSALSQHHAQMYWNWTDLDEYWAQEDADAAQRMSNRQLSQSTRMIQQIKTFDYDDVSFDVLMQITALLGDTIS